MNEFFAAILAGGKSSRFGQDKALLKFNGTYLLNYIYSQLSHLISVPRIIGDYREEVHLPEESFIADRISNIGPLGGLYTALSQSSSPVLIVPCDMPFLLSSHIKFLLNKYDKKYEATIAVSPKGIEPLLGIYKPETLNKLENFIQRKDYALYKFIKSIDTKYVKYSKNDYTSSIFFNINTLSDYKKALYLKEQN